MCVCAVCCVRHSCQAFEVKINWFDMYRMRAMHIYFLITRLHIIVNPSAGQHGKSTLLRMKINISSVTNAITLQWQSIMKNKCIIRFFMWFFRFVFFWRTTLLFEDSTFPCENTNSYKNSYDNWMKLLEKKRTNSVNYWLFNWFAFPVPWCNQKKTTKTIAVLK